MSSALRRRLRAHAIAHSLFRPTTLRAAIERLGFVQADPIRAPAPAQDLVLRHRVRDYRVGDLARRYHSLGIEEDFLYAYGFMPRRVRDLLHPRANHYSPSQFESSVFAAVSASDGPVHPRQLDAVFGRERAVNAWGGFSKSTKIALERLHHHGLLRIARRENGVRIYEALAAPADLLPPDERLRKLVMVIADVLAPIPEQTLRAMAARLRRSIAGAADHGVTLRGLIGSGELAQCAADGITYVWPAEGEVGGERDVPRLVRLLAPFDPVVWDRRRFEHLWGWAYRFEAYTPAHKRVRGYYAMPLLWGEQVIGWANVAVAADRELSVEFGYVQTPPRDREFRAESEAELARLKAFLGSRDEGRAAWRPRKPAELSRRNHPPR